MEEPKQKKPSSEKRLTHLQKARVALVKARETRRTNMHTEAFEKIVDEKLNEKLAQLKVNEEPKVDKKEPIKPTAVSDESDVEEIEIRRKPKPKKKIIVVSESSSEDEVVVKQKQKPKRKPIPKKKAPEVKEQPLSQPPIPDGRQILMDTLYRNIFNR